MHVQSQGEQQQQTPHPRQGKSSIHPPIECRTGRSHLKSTQLYRKMTMKIRCRSRGTNQAASSEAKMRAASTGFGIRVADCKIRFPKLEQTVRLKHNVEPTDTNTPQISIQRSEDASSFYRIRYQSRRLQNPFS